MLSIAVSIPLIHYIYVTVLAIILFSIQLFYILKRNLFKYKILKYLRLIHTICFMIYNLLYVVFFLLDYYYPNLDVKILLIIGTTTIAILLLIYLLDLTQAIIDIGDKIYEKIQPMLCPKNKIKKVKNFT